MKTIKRFGVWALALAALAATVPQTSSASGSIRSITAYDPETGHREYGPNDLIRIGETLAFKVRLLNYNTNCTSVGGLNNPWSFRLRPGADPTFATNNLPKMGLWISGHKRYATYKSIQLADYYYTDIIFEYKVQSGDMALPVKFCNVSGTSELANSSDQMYLLENVGPISFWELKDEATGHTCEFSFGAQNLVPSSTDHFEYPPSSWSPASEVRDYDLSQAGIYVQTVDFDSDVDPWRTVYENKTTTADGNGLPALFILGGASEDSTVYLWTESTNVAYLANGGERIYHSLDHAGQPKDYLVYAANIVHATNFTFKVRGARGASGQTTTIYLSSTPTNIYNGAGTLINNFISRTIAVTNSARPEVSFELDGSTVVCDENYETAKLQMTLTVDAFTNSITIALNPTVGDGGTALPTGVLGISTSSDGALSYTDTITVGASSSMDDDPRTLPIYYVFGRGFATNDTFKTTSPTIKFSPTITGDGGAFSAIDPFTITVKEEKPAIDLANVSGGSISAVADDDYPIVLSVSDSYANLHDTDRGYEIWWKSTASSDWELLKSGAVANSDGELKFSIKYSSGGVKETSIRVIGPDGNRSASDVSFTANVASAKSATLVVDKDTDEEYPRQYFEGDIVKKIRIELQNWKNDENFSIYAFLEPLDGTENYITAAKFLTTTPSAAGLEIKRDATNTTATAQFTILDGLEDPGLDLNFNIILRDKKNWNDAGARTLKTFPADSITVYNVFPAFRSVTMSGTSITEGDGTKTLNTDQNIEKTFTWKIKDVAADLPGLTTVWTVYDPSGSPVDEQSFTGDPATPFSYKYKFLQKGVYTVTVRMRDKDMDAVAEDDWPAFRFSVDVGDAPKTVFAFPDGTDGSERYHFNERAVVDGLNDWFQVGLSTAAKDAVVIKVVRTRVGADGTLDLSGADGEGAVYVTIPAGQTIGPAGQISLADLDGTRESSRTSGGFEITATVTNTNLNADGVPYNEVYAPSSVRVFVDNVAPVVDVTPAAVGTNGYYEAIVSANEILTIEWDAEDVPADVNDNLELKWNGLPADATYTSGSARSASGAVQFSFSGSGQHQITLVVRDKDKGESETFTWVFRIRPSKNALLYPVGPFQSGQSDKSTEYLTGAAGLGEGRVYAENGECTGVKNFRQAWSFTRSTIKVPFWAWGYRVGDVDDGTLRDYDKAIDPNGNNTGLPLSSFYTYGDARDSFFYTWIQNVADDQGKLTGTSYPNPQIGTNSYIQQTFSLSTEEQGDEEDPHYDTLILEAVFALEYRPADNVGDINQDGIPDIFAVTKPFDAGKLFEQVAGGAGGGGDGGEGGIGTGGSDLKIVSAFNDDEDYLPAPTSAGNTLIPNVVENWATTGEKFTAYYEIRGFGPGLNYRRQANGINYNTRGEWISDPDFTPAETNAYLRYYLANSGITTGDPVVAAIAKIAATNDAAVVAAAKAECEAAGGNPDNDDEWLAYVTPTDDALNAALAAYLDSPEIKARALEDLAKSSCAWSPENRTDPTMADTDGDEFPDGYEYFFWYRALVGDAKGVQMVGSRFNMDNVAQGIEITPDEIAEAFNPTVASGIGINERDTDGDGLTDLEELAMGTNPVNWDTDGDGMSDLYEVMWGLNPLKKKDASENPDGDYMASWWSDPTWSIVTVPGVGVYAVNEAEAVLDGFVPEPEKDSAGILDVNAQGAFEGVPVFWYGPDGSTAVPKSVPAPLATLTVDVSGVTNKITVMRGQSIRLIHAQVYTAFGFDPRTGWGKTSVNGYVTPRWDGVGSGADDNFAEGDSGLAVNTEKFTSLDEYLLCKYRKETGTPAAKEKDDDDAADDSAADSALNRVRKMLVAWCTCPSMPFSGVSYGDGAESYGSEIYGADTDGDGMPDGWELYVSYRPDPLLPGFVCNPNDKKDASQLWDDDKLTFVSEYAGTDSCNAYSNTPSIFANHPGNAKGWFNKFFPTDPYNADTDGDGISDSDEGMAWEGKFFAGRKGGLMSATETHFTFIYGNPEDDGHSRCIRGGGLNPCTVDTDQDLLPDGWEYQFAGVVFGPEGRPHGNSLSDDVVKLFRVSDGLETPSGATIKTPNGYYITGGMDGTYGPCYEKEMRQPGDASTAFDTGAGGVIDPRTGTRRDVDWDHDGLQNFQEYLVQTLRHLRYDDSETPLMGVQLEDGIMRLPFNKCIPFQAFDGTAFYEVCRKAGFKATSAWKYRELGYFARPPHEWDRLALSDLGNNNCVNYKDYEGVGYRILLPPQGLSNEADGSNEKRFKSFGYVSTDPRRWDSDDDGMDDYWELFHGLNPLLGMSESMSLENDVIAAQYGGVPNAWINAWTGWPLLFPSQPAFDAMKYPWMMGTPECDADGDGIRNVEEGLFVNITTPQPKHTDPTPLWMTDKTSPNCASYTAQYYRLDPYVDPGNVGAADVYMYPEWGWSVNDSSGASDGQVANWMFPFEENEGYDTDGDRRPDNAESVKTVDNASDPLNFADPDLRQALYLPGLHASSLTGEQIGSAVVSRGGSDTMQKPISTCYDMLRQFTVEAWVKPEDVRSVCGDYEDQVILERVSNYGPSTLSNDVPLIRANFRIGITADRHFYAEYDGSAADSGTARLVGPAVTTNWTHLAFTYDGSTVALYVNDESVPVVKAENVSLIPANGIVIMKQEAGSLPVLAKGYTAVPCALIIGARAVTGDAIALSKYTTWDAYSGYYTGWIDEVRIWDGARTGAEIAADYRHRYSFGDVKSQRQTVYDSWLDGATRNDTVGQVLPAELLQHYSFSTLGGAVDAGAIPPTPLDFGKNVLDNVRIDGEDESRLGTGGINCGWWWELPVHSDVYYDYHIVPWIQNTCAHLPFMDGSVPDSMYWSEGFGGLTPAAMDGLTAYSFPNSANPYSVYNYLTDRSVHLQRLDSLGTSWAYASYAYLYMFQMRAGFVGTSDLVPLGGAVAKRTAMMWDGAAADAWTQTGPDSDSDGLPDWWEEFVAAGGNAEIEYVGKDGNPLAPEDITWSAMVWRQGVQMTLAQAYLRDLAGGMVYRYDETSGAYAVAVDTAYEAKVDDNRNGIFDWWENLYSLYGEETWADHDNDQLSNYAEYLISECFTRVNGVNRKSGYDAANDIFKTLDPTAMHTYRDEGQLVPDYFRRVGLLYLGEMFADHDFMEDLWEDGFAPDSTSRYAYNAGSDPDDDGWSNYAESRAGTDPSRAYQVLLDGESMPERPLPLIALKVSYPIGDQVLTGSRIVVNAYPTSRMDGVPDAVWSISAGEPQSFMRNLGVNTGEELEFSLGPGTVVPGSISVQFRDLNTLHHSEEGGSSWMHPSSTKWYEGLQEYYVPGEAPLLHGPSSDTIGTVDYETGRVTLDLSKLPEYLYHNITSGTYTYYQPSGSNEWVRLRLPKSFIRISWSGKVFAEERTWETTLSLPNVAGYLREGFNMFEVFADKNGDGKWNAGEPYGVANAVDIGWNKTTVEIELSDTHSTMARYDLSLLSGLQSSSSGSSSRREDSSETIAMTDRDVNGSYYGNITPATSVSNVPSFTSLRLKVVRTHVNGRSSGNVTNFSTVVLDRTFNAQLHPFFTEADLLADGQLDLDWGGIEKTWSDVFGGAKAAISNAAYRVVVDTGMGETTDASVVNEMLPAVFVNAFEAQEYQTPTKPLAPVGTIDSGRPTFTWQHDNSIGKSYPAFQLKVWKADGTTLVYDSGVRRAPPRNSDGVYSWTAPLYANMVTDQGQIFATTNNYRWAVSMLDAKFTTFPALTVRAPYKVETKGFRLECSGASGAISDYGAVELKVKYFGPGTVSTAATTSRAKLIRVQAFDTADFTGDPAGEAYVADVTDLASITNLTVNARIIGLKPGTYYVRAFIDTDGDGVRSPWESWGYANYVGTTEKSVYTPKPLTVSATENTVPFSAIYIEDADTDNDGFPDIYEMEKEGDLDAIGSASGPTYFTEVNPDLKGILMAYADMNLEAGYSDASSAPVFRLMSVATTSASGLDAATALLSGTPEVQASSDVSVTIESFSMEEGISVRVDTVTVVDSSGLLAVRTAPVTFDLELRHKATLAEEGWDTVASVPLTVSANETRTLTGDDLAVLRTKIAEMKGAVSSGFFKVVLKQR